MSYEIKETPHGLLVFGSMPIDDMAALSKVWEKRGFTHLAPGIASALGATLAVTGDVNAWKKIVEAQVKEQHQEDKQLAWLRGTDTGTSSKTIFSVLCRSDLRSAVLAGGFRPDVPYDPDDFSRCHRLLVKLDWRDRLPEVAQVYTAWVAFVKVWDQMVSLYVESHVKTLTAQERRDKSKELYTLLQNCRGGK